MLFEAGPDGQYAEYDGRDVVVLDESSELHGIVPIFTGCDYCTFYLPNYRKAGFEPSLSSASPFCCCLFTQQAAALPGTDGNKRLAPHNIKAMQRPSCRA